MSANGISTLPTKAARRDAKLTLAAAKRYANGNTFSISYRPYNLYISPGTVSPATGHPWLLHTNIETPDNALTFNGSALTLDGSYLTSLLTTVTPDNV